MKILVTGGAGFIGSHLCERLLAEGHQVVNFDNFYDYYDPQIKRKNVRNSLLNENYVFYEADIRDDLMLKEIFRREKIDAVVHLAAMAGVRPSIENPLLYTEVNIVGTVNILNEIVRNRIKNYIFASSSSVYGNNEKVPFSEDDNVDFPISPYAASKKSIELIAYTYHHLYKISTIGLRFFTVYGPRQRPDLAIHKFAKKIILGEKISLFGDGSTKRDYTYIDDIIDGVVRAIKYTTEKLCYEIFNLGESRTVSLMEMVSVLEKKINKKAITEFLPMQPGDVEQTSADISKSTKMLGYNPRTDFEEGISKFIEWLQNEDFNIFI